MDLTVPAPIKALFLDRDGVVNVDHGYVSKREDFVFRDDIFDFCRVAQTFGYKLFIITNQSGISRGYYSEEDYHLLTNWMAGEFEKQGIRIEQIYYCPYHDCALQGDPDKEAKLFFRKPNPGMLFQAGDEHGIDMARSLMVGDQEKDMEAAHAAGVGFKILLTEEEALPETKADLVVSRLSGDLFSLPLLKSIGS